MFGHLLNTFYTLQFDLSVQRGMFIEMEIVIYILCAKPCKKWLSSSNPGKDTNFPWIELEERFLVDFTEMHLNQSFVFTSKRAVGASAFLKIIDFVLLSSTILKHIGVVLVFKSKIFVWLILLYFSFLVFVFLHDMTNLVSPAPQRCRTS